MLLRIWKAARHCLLRPLSFAVAAAALAHSAAAQDITAMRNAIDSETRGSVFPGPREGETRPVWVWRPRGAFNLVLPVLYTTDGLDGIYVALIELKPAIDAGSVAPIMIVSLEANPRAQSRAAEYLRGWPGGGDDYEIHARWFLEQVIPWAERTQHASPAHRFVGGFSNGADFALSMANTHPDLFAGALVHSPVGASADWIEAGAANQRWVITGGTQEQAGSTQRGGQLPRSIAQALERRGAPLRSCIGAWGHEGRAWRQLSAGALVWLMDLGDAETIASERERRACRTGP